MNKFKIIFYGVSMGAVIVAFQNCAPSQHVRTLTSQEQSLCEQDLLNNFKHTAYSYVAKETNCKSCHDEEGVSPYKFAADDVDVAYTHFNTVGIDRMSANAVNPIHADGITGPQRQEAFDHLLYFWELGYNKLDSCIGMDSVKDPGVALTPKRAESIYFADNLTQTLTWRLLNVEDHDGNDMGLLPLEASVRVRIKYETVDGQLVATGYEFSQPRVRALVGNKQYRIEGLFVTVNGAYQVELQEYTRVNKVIKGIADTELATPVQVARVNNLSNFDTFGMYFKKVTAEDRTDNPPTPPNPTLAFTRSVTSSLTNAITISNDATAVRWCLSIDPRKPAGLDECPGRRDVPDTYNGWYSTRPTTVDLSTFRAIATGESMTIYVWVLNSDLKVNNAAGSATITLDQVEPNAPVLNSASIDINPATGGQFANISMTGPPDAVQYCAKEFAILDDNVNANGCIWKDTPPTFIGVTLNASKIMTFVRDAAGNVSDESNAIEVSNPYGPITYTQLMATGGAFRSVFRNHCMSCHAVGMPNVGVFNVESYADAVAKRTRLRDVFVTQGAANATHGALIDSKKREIIRVWLIPTTPKE